MISLLHHLDQVTPFQCGDPSCIFPFVLHRALSRQLHNFAVGDLQIIQEILDVICRTDVLHRQSRFARWPAAVA